MTDLAKQVQALQDRVDLLLDEIEELTSLDEGGSRSNRMRREVQDYLNYATSPTAAALAEVVFAVLSEAPLPPYSTTQSTPSPQLTGGAE